VQTSQCSLSQVGRQSFPHRPTHLNWFRPSSRAPPHSGQMQFAMADLTFAFDRIKLSTSNSFTEKKTGLSRGQSAHNICDALDLGVFLLDVDRFPLSRKLFLITCLSLIRALASRAFTVPVGTPRRCAVSRMLKPSTSRNRKAVRRVGESRTVDEPLFPQFVACDTPLRDLVGCPIPCLPGRDSARYRVHRERLALVGNADVTSCVRN